MNPVEQGVWSQLAKHLDNPIVLVVVLAAVVYLFVSKRLAEISGPIGALARWWNGRQVAKVQRQRELWRAQHDSDREREDAELADLRADVRYLRRELDDMKARERLRDQQARKHTAWDNAVVAKLQAARIPVDDPPPLYLDLAPMHISAEEGT